MFCFSPSASTHPVCPVSFCDALSPNALRLSPCLRYVTVESRDDHPTKPGYGEMYANVRDQLLEALQNVSKPHPAMFLSWQ